MYKENAFICVDYTRRFVNEAKYLIVGSYVKLIEAFPTIILSMQDGIVFQTRLAYCVKLVKFLFASIDCQLSSKRYCLKANHCLVYSIIHHTLTTKLYEQIVICLLIEQTIK